MTNEELVSLIQRGESVKSSLWKLYKQNQGLLWKLCQKYSYDQEMGDLMQQAYIGLHRAAYEYRKDAGASFCTYAFPVIKRELQRYIASCGRLIRISEREYYMYYEYRRIEEYFLKIFGRKPTVPEFARLMEVPSKTVIKLQKTLYRTSAHSLDIPLGEDTEDTLMDLTADKTKNVEEDYAELSTSEESKKTLQEEISRLDAQQQALIRLRMKGVDETQAARIMGITREQARTLEYKALRELRHNKKVLQIGRDMGIVCW